MDGGRPDVNHQGHAVLVHIAGGPAAAHAELAQHLAAALKERGLLTRIGEPWDLAAELLRAPDLERWERDALVRRIRVVGALLRHRKGAIVLAGDLEADREIRMLDAIPTAQKAETPPPAAPGAPPHVMVPWGSRSARSEEPVLQFLESRQWIPAGTADGYSAEDDATVEARLRDLGYM
jgi:hypothetical protein